MFGREVEMKKILLFLLFFLPINVFATNQVDITLFYGEGCPHCDDEKEFLAEIDDEYDLNVKTYEVWSSKENEKLLKEVLDALDYSYRGVPVTVIGESVIVGFSEYLEKDFISLIEKCSENVCDNAVQKVIDGEDIVIEEPEIEDGLNVPFFGKIDPKKASLPLITIVLGAVDGFNPCAMWVLLFLISMLVPLKDAKKRWILGITFIFFSAATYFLFMSAWLNLIFLVSAISIIRILIGGTAFVAGAINVKKFIKIKDDGCDVVPVKKRGPVFEKIKKIVYNKNLLFAMLGIAVLAISVNVLELVCSLGLPVIYTQILSMAELSKASYYGYLLLYNLFFMIDDIIIFSIAMIFLKVTGISTKYTKYSHLIGGLLMVIIGLLLIFSPEVLMFG